MRVHPAHQLGRVREIGIGPLHTAPVRSVVAVELYQAMADDQAVGGGHEIHVAGVAGRDDGLPVAHRLAHREAEALGAMERDVAVAELDERVDLVPRQHVAHDGDVRHGRGLEHLPRALRQHLGMDALQHEQHVVARRERLTKRAQQAKRVLAVEVRREVEDEEEDEAVLCPAEVGAGERGRRARRQGIRDADDRDRGVPRDRVLCEGGWDPDLVEVVEAALVRVREARQLPTQCPML